MIAALLLAQVVVGPPATAVQARETVRLGWDARAKTCSVRVHGAEVGDPRTEAGRIALLDALPDLEKEVAVTAATEVPFACAQATFETLDKGGRRHAIGYVSGAPAPKP